MADHKRCRACGRIEDVVEREWCERRATEDRSVTLTTSGAITDNGGHSEPQDRTAGGARVSEDTVLIRTRTQREYRGEVLRQAGGAVELRVKVATGIIVGARDPLGDVARTVGVTREAVERVEALAKAQGLAALLLPAPHTGAREVRG